MIQQRAIRPLAFDGRDLIAQAQSGTGKTATFSIGLLQNIDPSLPSTQAIILSPTRELAKQTANVASAIALARTAVGKTSAGTSQHVGPTPSENAPKYIARATTESAGAAFAYCGMLSLLIRKFVASSMSAQAHPSDDAISVGRRARRASWWPAAMARRHARR